MHPVMLRSVRRRRMLQYYQIGVSESDISTDGCIYRVYYPSISTWNIYYKSVVAAPYVCRDPSVSDSTTTKPTTGVVFFSEYIWALLLTYNRVVKSCY